MGGGVIILRVARIGLIVILICAVCNVFLIIRNYGKVVTGFPLWMQVTAVIAFWGILLLLCIISYALFILIKKFISKDS